VLPFKKGAFHLAMQAQVPMIPVVNRNAGEIIPARSMILTPGTVQVRVLAPVPTDDWNADNLDEQVARVEEMYAETFDDWDSAPE
jgi:putative phosphoserine phosphatase/1-acylglycerol-3-phosphate O-acyltransferase